MYHKKVRIKKYQLEWMASTGLSFAALLAGITPATNPTSTEVTTPKRVSSGLNESTTSFPNCCAATNPNSHKTNCTAKSQIIPPAILNQILSIKNCALMAKFFAPIAF